MVEVIDLDRFGCCWMYKSTNFLANHNLGYRPAANDELLLDVQKY